MRTLAYPLLLAAATALLAGCGSDPAPAAAPSASNQAAAVADSTAPGVPCGDVAGAGGAKTSVVTHGQVDCAAATQVLKDYFAKLTPAETNSPDGPGPVPVAEWTCGSGPNNDPVTTCSTEDDRQIDATRG